MMTFHGGTLISGNALESVRGFSCQYNHSKQNNCL